MHIIILNIFKNKNALITKCFAMLNCKIVPQNPHTKLIQESLRKLISKIYYMQCSVELVDINQTKPRLNYPWKFTFGLLSCRRFNRLEAAVGVGQSSCAESPAPADIILFAMKRLTTVHTTQATTGRQTFCQQGWARLG